jgi:hypothetical protein
VLPNNKLIVLARSKPTTGQEVITSCVPCPPLVYKHAAEIAERIAQGIERAQEVKKRKEGKLEQKRSSGMDVDRPEDLSKIEAKEKKMRKMEEDMNATDELKVHNVTKIWGNESESNPSKLFPCHIFRWSW